MYARITSFEIDLLRTDMDSALTRFEEMILPGLREQGGYRGVFVLRTPEGKGLLITLWEDEPSAAQGLESGFYDEQVAKFITFLKQPPGRDHYEVAFSETTGGL